jgi:hypothetical protein
VFRAIRINQDRAANNAAYCAAPAAACAVSHKKSLGKDLLAVAA